MLVKKFRYKANYEFAILKLKENNISFISDSNNLTISSPAQDNFHQIQKYIIDLNLDENELDDTNNFSYREYIDWHLQPWKSSRKNGKFAFFLYSKKYNKLMYFYFFIVLLVVIICFLSIII